MEENNNDYNLKFMKNMCWFAQPINDQRLDKNDDDLRYSFPLDVQDVKCFMIDDGWARVAKPNQQRRWHKGNDSLAKVELPVYFLLMKELSKWHKN